MSGIALSRWTMSWFAAALGALIAAEALMAAGYGYPASPLLSPQTLVLVHLLAIGWLSFLMCGALFQFVPVLVAHRLHSDVLPLPALGCVAAGLAALLLGFANIGGGIGPDVPFFPVAAGLLAAGFALVVWNLGRTLWAARPLPLPARFVAVGLACLAATVAFGIVFALVLDGSATNPHLARLAAYGLPIHVVAGLGGWLTFTAMGVSYRLLSMFMLSPERGGPATRGVLYAGVGALGIVIVGGTLAICLGGQTAALLGAGAAVGLAALGLYGRDVVCLYRARKRRRIELNSRMAAVALANLALFAVLVIVLLAVGAFDDDVAAAVFLLAFGFLSGLGLAKLYKIVAFVTWLECYGPVLGRATTPRVQDLVVESRAVKWFALYFISIWGGTAALLSGTIPGFRLCAGAALIATVGIAAELVRTRLLADVRAPLRHLVGTRPPRLLLASNQHP